MRCARHDSTCDEGVKQVGLTSGPFLQPRRHSLKNLQKFETRQSNETLKNDPCGKVVDDVR